MILSGQPADFFISEVILRVRYVNVRHHNVIFFIFHNFGLMPQLSTRGKKAPLLKETSSEIPCYLIVIAALVQMKIQNRNKSEEINLALPNGFENPFNYDSLW